MPLRRPTSCGLRRAPSIPRHVSHVGWQAQANCLIEDMARTMPLLCALNPVPCTSGDRPTDQPWACPPIRLTVREPERPTNRATPSPGDDPGHRMRAPIPPVSGRTTSTQELASRAMGRKGRAAGTRSVEGHTMRRGNPALTCCGGTFHRGINHLRKPRLPDRAQALTC